MAPETAAARRRRSPTGRGTGRLSALAFALTAAVALSSLLPLWGAPADSASRPGEAAAGAAETALARPPAPWGEASAAVRRGDLADARRLVEPLAAGDSPAAAEARLALGLWARAAAEHERCAALLGQAIQPGGRFEDWRLLTLAECHAEMGRLPAAAAALDRLLERHRGTPLRSTALLLATTVRLEMGDLDGALRLIERGRRERLSRDEAQALERTAWEIASASGNPELERQVARHLLVHHPILASQLQVIELFRQPSGQLDWPAFLGVDQLPVRATSLLAAGISAGALEALEAVPPPHRDRAWSLLRAEALVASGRGGEALALLDALPAAGGAAGLRREELRAAAAADAARARPGATLPAAERERLRQLGRQALWRVIELAGDEPAHRQAAIRAHRRLLDELLEEEMDGPALALLKSLRRLDPEDTRGARFLWQRGWREYQRRNPSGAIGYWTELTTIYPDSGYDRSGRYWSGRAHEALGERQRAVTIYRQVIAAGVGDFYDRHARARLDLKLATRPAAEPEQPREPWPWDPGLLRARWLGDRGLDEEALTEIRGLGERVEPRAAAALAALVEARRGRPRDSIHQLARAFPQLGRPQQASAPEAALRLYYPDAYAEIVRRFAAAHGIEPPLLFAMIRQESAFDATAVSRAGARGLMQLMPATGRELARRLRLGYSSARLEDPEFNVRLGSKYFRQVLEMFDGNEELALAGYNGGPYRIRRLWREHGPAAELDRFVEGLELSETRRYVKRILLFRDSYDRLYPNAA